MVESGKTKLLVALMIILMAVIIAGLYYYGKNGIKDSHEFSQASSMAYSPEIRAVEHVAYRKTSEFDPGTIQVFLRNAGDRDLSFSKVILDGLPIPVWGVDLNIENTAEGISEDSVDERNEDEKVEHKGAYSEAASRFSGKRVLWAKIEPPVIPVEGMGEFSAKLVNPLPRPMKIAFQSTSGDELTAIVRPVSPQVQITSITFDDDFRNIYVYMKGCDKVFRICGLQINGKWFEAEVDGVDDVDTGANNSSLCLSSPSITSSDKTLAIVGLKEPFKQGEYVTVRLVCENGVEAEECLRAFSGFPLTAEHGVGTAKFNLDETTYTLHPRYAFKKDPEKYAPPSPAEASLQGNYIFDCQMHRFGGDRERCALESIRRHQICLHYDPCHPTFNHLCRIRPETGYALFSETGDILRINPNINTGLSKGGDGESEEETVSRITRFAMAATRPRPVHSLADTSAFSDRKRLASPEEFRRRMYSVLGMGVKGIFYRHHGRNDPLALKLTEEVCRFNAELGHLRKYLAIADTVDWIKSETKSVSSYSLLAGDKAIVLILVNNNHGGGKGLSAGDSSLTLKSYIPKWFAPGEVLFAQGDKLIANTEAIVNEKNIILGVPLFASAYIIKRAR